MNSSTGALRRAQQQRLQRFRATADAKPVRLQGLPNGRGWVRTSDLSRVRRFEIRSDNEDVPLDTEGITLRPKGAVPIQLVAR